MTTLLEQLGITYPIIQAPMAGGATTAELVATVSNFGALGSFAAGMTAPHKIKTQIHAIPSLTKQPFLVNLMVLSEADTSTFSTATPDWAPLF